MSALRKLVPEQRVEAMAAQQYAGLKQQAGQKGALAPDDNPQVIRLRAIAQRMIPHVKTMEPRRRQVAVGNQPDRLRPGQRVLHAGREDRVLHRPAGPS